MINPVDGVIVIQDRYKPAWALTLHKGETPKDEELPRFRSWSDVVYLLWSRLHMTPKAEDLDFTPFLPPLPPDSGNEPLRMTVKFLNYVMVQAVEGPRENLQIVASCLASRGYDNGRFPEWEDRQTFPIGVSKSICQRLR